MTDIKHRARPKWASYNGEASFYLVIVVNLFDLVAAQAQMQAGPYQFELMTFW